MNSRHGWPTETPHSETVSEQCLNGSSSLSFRAGVCVPRYCQNIGNGKELHRQDDKRAESETVAQLLSPRTKETKF